MDRCNLFSATVLVAALTIPTIASSALVGRLADSNGNYQAYYDTEADLTWLADANAGAGSIYDDGALSNDGLMTWQSANNWADSFEISGISDWRLTTAENRSTCELPLGGYELNCTGIEMGNLFYNTLGNTSYLSNTGPFINLTPDSFWTSTEYIDDELAYRFYFFNGGVDESIKTFSAHAWAVHDGDIGAEVSAIPIPASMWLLGSGLVGLIGLARRRK